MKQEQKKQRVEALIARGFDGSHIDECYGFVTVSCSQCVAAVINGVACHEHSCPNKRTSDSEQTY